MASTAAIFDVGDYVVYPKHGVGRVIELQRPAGRATAYAYDPVGRLLALTHHDGTQARFVYRADGELLEAHTADHAVLLEKDAAGQVLCETQGAHRVESDYDAFGQRLALRSSLGAAVTTARGRAGHVEQMQAGA